MAVVPPLGCEHCSRSRLQELGSLARAVNQTALTTNELDGTLIALNTRADDDAAAETIQTVLWVLVSISALFLGLRIYCKVSYSYTKIRFEDILLIASWRRYCAPKPLLTRDTQMVLATDASLNEFIIKSRFGRPGFPITVDNISVLAIIGLASITCSFVGQVWSKTAFAISLLRMCDGWKKAFVWFSIISMNVLFTFSALSFWIGCVPLEKRWKPFSEGTCYDLKWVVSFGIFVSVYSGVLDIALAIVPWLILMRPTPAEASSGLTLSKKEKIGVSVAMSMGVLAGMAAFVKASYMRSVNDVTGDFSREFSSWS
ncbi:Integral membrane protein [Colletotrichum higginsianum IMI 349063]|uniref:Integral membrane protein n=1 Tax=Colletotrichum higginsianum (strain IMI 349063) TaxID=759273 RepID=A0A1B7XYS2_COLHI|nr:Integral membrane protein [Colletotrichum higginsianum IMI 349063]OBR04899.1 Integral membrane protein [Colletotrichum higginsianum IMI 349063]